MIPLAREDDKQRWSMACKYVEEEYR